MIALAGTVVMFFDPGEARRGWTSFALLGVAALAASESVVLSKLVGPEHPMAMNAVGMTSGALALLAVAVLGGDEPRSHASAIPSSRLPTSSPRRWGCSLHPLRRSALDGVRDRVHVRLDAGGGGARGAALLDEPITAAVVAGGAIVVAGVYVGALSRSRGRKGHLARGRRRSVGGASR